MFRNFMQFRNLFTVFVSFLALSLTYTEAMHIVAITGSLRKASCNTGVLRAMQKVLPEGHTMDVIVPGDLPLFNQDLERPDLVPPAVVEFRKRLKAADCFLFSLSEYNYSISGVAKNAIDWGSRGADGGNLFANKPAAVVSSGGGMGGMRAASHLRDIALFLDLHFMNKPELYFRIFQQPSPFNLETGDLINEDDHKKCAEFMEAFIAWSQRIAQK